MTTRCSNRRGAPRARPLVLVLEGRERDVVARLAGVEADVVACPSVEALTGELVACRPEALLLVDDGDALDVLPRVRAMRGGETLPILVATSAADPVAMEQLLGAGADDLCARLGPGALLGRRLLDLLGARRARGAIEGLGSQLARARRIASMVQWHFDREARIFRWTHEPTSFFPGLEGEGALADTLLRWVHPDDRGRVEASFASTTSARPPIEYRLVLPGGEHRVVEQHADEEPDEASGRVCLVGLGRDVTSLREAERQVDRLAYYDELTSLPNRAHASRFLAAALVSAKRRKRGVTMMVLDLDRFRRVNDRFGHAGGNVVMKEVASRLIRANDERAARGRSNSLVARLGADEFAVIFGDVGPDDAPLSAFRTFSEHLSAPFRLAGADLVISVSAGVASYPADGTDVETLFTNADSAFHSAKKAGPRSFVAFDAGVKKRLDRKLEVEDRLRIALANRTSLELHYQPKVEVPSGRVAGVEALVRWTAADGGGPISPIEIVTVAEETGLIHPLGDWILRTACEQAKVWADRTPARVAVNISAHQLAADDFLVKLEKVLEETGLPAHLLELEITEGVMMADAEAASRVLARVKELGLRIALDDFGTGYSSLAYLTRFPIDTLKIDRSFVVGIGVTKKSETIVSAILALAKSLELEVVAEGVETDAQRQFLEGQGRLEIQGWLFSKALPPEAAGAWMEERANQLASATMRSLRHDTRRTA